MPKSRLTPAQKLADLLHSLKCRHNHTDACSWGYITDRWTLKEGQKKYDEPMLEYFEMAERILATFDYGQAIKFLSAEHGPKVVDNAIRQLG
jgi:hypothetical protein